MTTHQIKVSKCTEKELNEVRDFLYELNNIIEENEHYEEDSEINKEISDVARKIPERFFIVPMNLGILLDNYQDKENDILEHPKWIMDLYKKIDTLEEEINLLKNNH